MNKLVGVLLVAMSLVMAACAPPTAAPPSTTAPPPGPVIGTCFDDTAMPGTNDAKYVGPANALANLEVWSSSDGTCSGMLLASLTAVVAVGEAAALAACQALDGAFQSLYVQAPPTVAPPPGPNFWVCSPNVPPPPFITGCNDLPTTFDLLYNGSINTADNAEYFDSTEGTCDGNLLGAVTLVQAPTDPLRLQICQGLNASYNIVYYIGPPVPSDIGYCAIA